MFDDRLISVFIELLSSNGVADGGGQLPPEKAKHDVGAALAIEHRSAFTDVVNELFRQC